MSILFYKQRFRHPNFPDTPKHNYAHIRYIATRAGVMKNTEMKHGLFGKLYPGEMQEFKSWKDVAREVWKLSENNTNIYRAIISFNRDTANELGLISQKDWQRYIETHIMTIAKMNNIKVQNFGFVCSVHNERHHPHIHIDFWDKEQQFITNYTSKEIPNNIRKQLIKDTFEDRIKAFYEQKDRGRADISEITDEMLVEFEKYIKELYPHEYSEYKKLFETYDEDSIISNPAYARFNKDFIDKMSDRLFKLVEKILKSGRISCKLMPEEVKAEIDTIVAKLIRENASLRQGIELYVDSKMNLAKLYSGDDKYLAKQKARFTKEAERIVANRVLSAVKALLKKEREIENFKFTEEQENYYTEQMILGILDSLGRKTIASNRKFEDKVTGSELSKQAKKEYLLKNKDKGIEP